MNSDWAAKKAEELAKVLDGLDCPLQLAAKCCREAVRHLERERLCAAYVIDGDGLATGGKA